ncbi:MAG: transporter substrate-binding domain-containing protein [Gammaproteobacteria bacterium]|nr:transporter substrate-binding domain-containing protein [Gammaproteobacteria bacterium]
MLRALVTPSRTNFFIDDGRIRGIQADFLYAFVDWLNRDVEREADRVRLKFVPVRFSELIPSLEEGRGDLIAAFLTRTPERAERVRLAPGFRLSANEVVVTHADTEVPASLEDLSGRTLVVLEGSSHEEHLQALNERFAENERAPMQVRSAGSRLYADDILELVNAGAIEMTVVDDYVARLWSKVLPDLRIHPYLAVTQDNALGWGLPRESDQLATALEQFAGRVRQGSLLGNILFTRYFENVSFIDNPLQRARRDRLEELMPLFERYGERYDIAPLALAAQAYQESRLDHSLRSHRGAVGIMQLLPSTASDPQVGIPDIDSVESNIHAGPGYLAFLRDRYFADPAINEWDRRAMSWAAYNAGPRAIRRVRDRAEEMGLDPDVWSGQVEVATGYVIGREPINYVANIQKYFLAYRLARTENDARERIQSVADAGEAEQGAQ